ncbi:MAG: hypothetical protein ACREPM_01935 [Gemmatimonadaceae bacterium]
MRVVERFVAAGSTWRSTTRRSLFAMTFTAAVANLAAAQTHARDSAATLATDSAYHRETFGAFLRGTFGPRPALRAVGLAGFDQWRGRPSSFPRNWRGFEDRLGSRFGQVAISHTLRSGLSRAVDQRPIRFTPSDRSDSVNRVLRAIESPLRVMTPSGARLSMLNPVTETISGILVTSVHPGGLSVRNGVLAGVTGIAGESCWSLVREFWPWRWRPPFI